jgi:hypothetical protein
MVLFFYEIGGSSDEIELFDNINGSNLSLRPNQGG